MNIKTKSARTRDRAARLQHEALNCLTIAVREDGEDASALLIDEAIRLAKRARELGSEVEKAA